VADRERPAHHGDVRYAFGVGFNNFATGRGAMAQLLARAESRLPEVEIAAWYGATGNYALLSDLSDRDLAEAMGHAFAEAMGHTFEREFALVSLREIKQAISACQAWKHPPRKRCERWTPGAAFRVKGPPPPIALRPSHRGRYRRLSDDAVAVLKRDIETPEGRLDPRRRQGGWGAISAEIAKQVDGLDSVWTARSLRPILGLLAKAEANT
jgi:hypothetical protein